MKKIEAIIATGIAIKISTKNQSTAHAHPHDAILDTLSMEPDRGLWEKKSCIYTTRLYLPVPKIHTTRPYVDCLSIDMQSWLTASIVYSVTIN